MPPKVSLFTAQSIDDAWEELAAPWFQIRREQFGLHEKPNVVVTPSQTCNFYIKQLLIRQGISTIGIDFWTPGQLRQHLLQKSENSRPIALREDLHLLMSIAAEEAGDNPAYQSIIKDPSPLMRAYDQLAAAGYSATAFNDPYWRNIAAKFETLFEQTGFANSWNPSQTTANATGSKTTIHSLLYLGFNAIHWNHFFLLQTGIQTAEESTVCLDLSKDPKKSDEVWLGSWEETYGESQEVFKDHANYPFEPLAESLCFGGEHGEEQIEYYITENVRNEAKAIAIQTLRYLREPTCSRIGVVFSQPSVLTQEVLSIFNDLELPHCDHFGQYPVQSVKQALLNRWIAMQIDPRLVHFINFIRQCAEAKLISNIELSQIERQIGFAFDIVITDDVQVIEKYLKLNNKKHASTSTLGFFESWPFLPKNENFAKFISAVEKPLSQMGWKTEELWKNIDGLKNTLINPIDRTIFLRWLDETLKTPGRARALNGRNPFARVHVINLDNAAAQEWSHVILAGLNQQHWPPENNALPALNDDDINNLNRSATRTGSLGEGHLTIKEGKALIPSSTTRKAYSYDAFLRLINKVDSAITVTASLNAECDFNSPTSISDYFIRLHLADTRTVLGDDELLEIVESTNSFIQKNQNALHPAQQKKKNTRKHALLQNIEPMKKAYTIRRTPDQPFGEFEFAYRTPPPDGLHFSCKAWEETLKRPASIWLESVIHVRKKTDFEDAPSWALANGLWVHDWLCPNKVYGFVKRPSSSSWLDILGENANALKHTVANAYTACERMLPDWWQSAWTNAKAQAINLAQSLDKLNGWPVAASELKLPHDACARIPDVGELPLTGRTDLILSTNPKIQGQAIHSLSEIQPPLWIIDFKTGSDKPLKPSMISNGEGLQLALYALAWHTITQSDVSISIIRPDSPLKEQVRFDDIITQAKLLSGIINIQKTGVIGQCGLIKNKFAFVGDYPLATISIPQEILQKKWVRTHPHLPCPK